MAQLATAKAARNDLASLLDKLDGNIEMLSAECKKRAKKYVVRTNIFGDCRRYQPGLGFGFSSFQIFSAKKHDARKTSQNHDIPSLFSFPINAIGLFVRI